MAVLSDFSNNLDFRGDLIFVDDNSQNRLYNALDNPFIEAPMASIDLSQLIGLDLDQDSLATILTKRLALMGLLPKTLKFNTDKTKGILIIEEIQF